MEHLGRCPLKDGQPGGIVHLGRILKRPEDVFLRLGGLVRAHVDPGDGVERGTDPVRIAALLVQRETLHGIFRSLLEIRHTEIADGQQVQAVGARLIIVFGKFGQRLLSISDRGSVRLHIVEPFAGPVPYVRLQFLHRRVCGIGHRFIQEVLLQQAGEKSIRRSRRGIVIEMGQSILHRSGEGRHATEEQGQEDQGRLFHEICRLNNTKIIKNRLFFLFLLYLDADKSCGFTKCQNDLTKC